MNNKKLLRFLLALIVTVLFSRSFLIADAQSSLTSLIEEKQTYITTRFNMIDQRLKDFDARLTKISNNITKSLNKKNR